MARKQKERIEENRGYSSNPLGIHVRDRKYRGETPQEQRDEMLIEQVVNPHKNPYTERVTPQQIAKERGVRKITNKNREWILIDGVEVYSPSLKRKETYLRPDDTRGNSHEQNYERAETIGTYDSNNGVITLVDENGDRYIAPWSKERMRVLKSAGYKVKSQYVPCSNGDLPTDPELKKFLLKGFSRNARIGEKEQERSMERSKGKRTLENHLTIFFFSLSIFIILFLSYSKITGYVIADNISNYFLGGGTIIFLLLVIFTIWIKQQGKK